MWYEIVFSPEAVKALRSIRPYDRVAVLDTLETHLRHEPKKISKSRIKALRDLQHPQYRLRAGSFRVFYDVTPEQVEVLAVVSKAESAEWLSRWGIRIEEEEGLP